MMNCEIHAPRKNARALRERLALPPDALGDRIDHGWARGALHVTQVREADGARTSAAFNYYRCAYTGNEDIAAELDRLAAAFELPGDAYRAWRAATDSLQIIDVAA